MRIRAPVLPLLVLTAACARDAERAELSPDARVRVTAERLGPGWHEGMVGAVGDCLVVMVPEPPEAPVRLRPIQLADISELHVSRRYGGAGNPPRLWVPGADTTGEGWTNVSVPALRQRYGGCTP